MMSVYTCKTLVHLHLRSIFLPDVEVVSLPRLKIIHLGFVTYSSESILEKLISGSPVLEDLILLPNGRFLPAKELQVRSQTLKRAYIEHGRIVIDAPLLQCFKTKSTTMKNFHIINLGFSTKLDINGQYYSKYSKSVIHDILTDISRVRDLVISNHFWKGIMLYSNSGPVLQFRGLSRLNARFSKSNLEMLPTIFESCPRLESLTMELVKGELMCGKKTKEPTVLFSAVPQCLVSSLKFVELKHLLLVFEVEMDIVRYILKNSTILEKLNLRFTSHLLKLTRVDAFRKEVIAMPRCSFACEVLFSLGTPTYTVQHFV